MRSPVAGKKRPSFDPHHSPRDPRGTRDAPGVSEGRCDLRTGRCGGRDFLRPEGQGEAHGRLTCRQGTDDRARERGKLFWRRLAGGPGSPHRICGGHDQLRAAARGQGADVGGASAGTRVGRPVPGVTCWPATSGPKKTWSIYCSTRVRGGWPASCFCWLISARMASTSRGPEDQSADAGRHGRHHAVTRQLLHESIQENWVSSSTAAARTVPLSRSTARCSALSCTTRMRSDDAAKSLRDSSTSRARSRRGRRTTSDEDA